MTIYPLQVGKTYRTRDGSAEHTIDKIENVGSSRGPVAWSTDNEAWWANTGKRYGDEERPSDLVEEVHPTAPTAEGPVRRRTVTTTEIVPGIYGRVYLPGFDHTDEGNVAIGFMPKYGGEAKSVHMNAEELDALAAIATQLAGALRAIAAEKKA